MRRISTGVQGRSILGSFVAETNRFTTRELNQDLVLEPAGTGIIRAEKHVKINGTAGSLILETDNGNEVVLQTASGSGYTLTMPTSAPSAGEVLISDASGNLTFDDINLPVSNQIADTATYYPLMNTATGGDITGVSVSSSKLSFQPSSGRLTANEMQVTDNTASTTTTTGALVVSGGVGIGGQVTTNNIQITATTTSTSMTTGALVVAGGIGVNSTSTMAQINPGANNTYDLGTTAFRWRNIYTNDLHLSNGIGDYTIVEGEEDLFLYNNKSNKVFKFSLIEVDPKLAPAKAEIGG